MLIFLFIFSFLACEISGEFQGFTGGCPYSSLLGSFSGYPDNDGPYQTPKQVQFSTPSICTAMQYKDIATKIRELWETEELECPKANRLAFHAPATFTAAGGPAALGGPNGGWFQFPSNFDFKENSGLQDTVIALKKVKEEFPCITFADVVFFAGAILTEAPGGPAIAWIPGRQDALSPGSTSPPLAARLPDGSFTIAAVNYFYTQLGLSPRELVALNGGGHSFGAADLEGSGWNGTFTPAADFWPSPLNTYFIQSFELEWEPVMVRSKNGERIQYVISAGQAVDPYTEEGTAIIRIPSDVAILTAGGSLTAWAKSYAQNETLFVHDFCRVMQRMSQFGAGASWEPQPDQYVWLGINNTATNFGSYISVQDGEAPWNPTPTSPTSISPALPPLPPPQNKSQRGTWVLMLFGALTAALI